MTSDPIGLQGGINTFGYVGGNLLRWIDSEGKTLGTALSLITAAVTAGAGYAYYKKAGDLFDEQIREDKRHADQVNNPINNGFDIEKHKSDQFNRTEDLLGNGIVLSGSIDMFSKIDELLKIRSILECR